MSDDINRKLDFVLELLIHTRLAIAVVIKGISEGADNPTYFRDAYIRHIAPKVEQYRENILEAFHQGRPLKEIDDMLGLLK